MVIHTTTAMHEIEHVSPIECTPPSSPPRHLPHPPAISRHTTLPQFAVLYDTWQQDDHDSDAKLNTKTQAQKGGGGEAEEQEKQEEEEEEAVLRREVEEEDGGGSVMFSYAVLTTAAAARLRWLHERCAAAAAAAVVVPL